MRILHINCNYIGTTLHQRMMEKLDQLGYENRVYVPTHNANLAVIKPNENVIVSECFRKCDRLFFDYKQRKIVTDLQKKVSISEYDCIHAYTLFTDGNCARRLSKKYGIPYVVAVRNTDVNAFFAKMIHLRRRGVRIMREAKAIFFLSEAYRRQVFEKYVPTKYHEELKQKTHIIPNGIDDFWLNNSPTEENKLDGTIKLIYAGRIDRNKNIPTIQSAMKILQTRGYDVSLTVVGRVADQKLYDELKSDSFTTCVNPVPKEELISFYRSHNIFVMPSFTESFGLVYVEAMSQGLPVVYTKGQGFDGQFPEGAVGYHVSAHDANAVADGIERVIRNFDSIKNNVVTSSRVFNWTDISSEYDRIYKEIKQDEE